jgi:very-short-patch-repair endonuclease
MRGALPWQTNRSRVLRSTQPTAEAKLWSKLRNSQLGGYKFVRQMPIEDYFGDFVCRAAKLVVEIDGATHSSEQELAMDALRTADLEQLGYRVMRFDNGDVQTKLPGVLDAILEQLQVRLTAAPSPRSSRGEGWGEGQQHVPARRHASC